MWHRIAQEIKQMEKFYGLPFTLCSKNFNLYFKNSLIACDCYTLNEVKTPQNSSLFFLCIYNFFNSRKLYGNPLKYTLHFEKWFCLVSFIEARSKNSDLTAIVDDEIMYLKQNCLKLLGDIRKMAFCEHPCHIKFGQLLNKTPIEQQKISIIWAF